MGENRNGTWHTGLQVESLSTDNIVKKWEMDVGTGYSGPTVADGTVFLFNTSQPAKARSLH